MPETNPTHVVGLRSGSDPEVATCSRKKKLSLMRLSSVKRKLGPLTGRTTCTNHGGKKSGKERQEPRIQINEVVKIGTRAIISIAGNPMLATHWDGYPSSLGRDLLNYDRSIEAVVEVAKAHTIDSADSSLLDMLNGERIRQLAEKHQLTVQGIKAGKRRGNVISADDHEIHDLRLYADLAEYQYDISGKQIYFRPLDGWWPDALKHTAEFKLLTEKRVATARDK